MNKIKFVEQALTDVLGKEIGSEEVIEQYFSPNYIQIVDGKKINYEEFVAHLKVLKEATNNISITIKSIAEGQDCVHTQHIAHAEKKSGDVSEFEVFACFHLSEGKIVRCEELTRMIAGEKADGDLGSRV
ncbi:MULTISPECIES: nuclear transport factor 2 family protein [Providencia]|uniref:nuclear transport factor 2 family protein n=1 Tax=Providencia TaxID=586 RepID=UPI000EF873A1|nr:MULTISPECIES: nuclear transport factor 2 family protein [Providencia]EMF0916285.1 nuclear transport factor 2 family protein [Providencia stuartii]EMF0919857.1 nuclear transport factor 2 family protein [Providencia stuartii]MCR4078623.1 nuclear transport factor 2 family protein [Providencia stuartii]MTB81840.1 nuclear transport factor 2 family protein [Providencia stuartii]MTC17774.1 nuclear transport factor 2 family protein [Providencia stuartii]